MRDSNKLDTNSSFISDGDVTSSLAVSPQNEYQNEFGETIPIPALKLQSNAGVTYTAKNYELAQITELHERVFTLDEKNLMYEEGLSDVKIFMTKEDLELINLYSINIDESKYILHKNARLAESQKIKPIAESRPAIIPKARKQVKRLGDK